MIEFVKNIENFWKQDLETHTFARQVPFSAENFDHLDKRYYNSGHILQSFNEELTNAFDFKKSLGVDQGSVSWTCVLPNSILPTHFDTFYTLRKQHNISIERCIRYLVFLEDWVFGQYVGFENKNIVKWKSGDVWMFDTTEQHYGVNASNIPFNSCQVSTFK